MSHLELSSSLLVKNTPRLGQASAPHFDPPSILACGDSALLVDFSKASNDARSDDETGLLARVTALDRALLRHPPPGLVETVPAYCTLLVAYDPVKADVVAITRAVLDACRGAGAAISMPRRWRIPVVYGGEFGIDLEAVAGKLGVTADRVVEAHANACYTVAMIGFLPGFAYLSGLPAWLALPRLATPRPLVAAGGIAIGGAQTAIGSIAGPSGWNQIGRTPVVAFDRTREPVTFLEAGDEIELQPIDAAEFAPLAAAAANGELVAERLL